MSLPQRLRKAWYRARTRHVPDESWPAEKLRAAGFMSQYGQDRFVIERLGGRRGGVFFDVGAFDGVTFSNTCTLERELGWTGIAVEPAPASGSSPGSPATRCISIGGIFPDAAAGWAGPEVRGRLEAAHSGLSNAFW